MSDSALPVSAVVLAGGRATRMGGVDKGLVTVLDKPMVAWAIATLDPQVTHVVINANRNQHIYSQYCSHVVADAQGAAEDDASSENTKGTAYLGPLAGMLAALSAVSTDYLVTAPCDSPLLPDDLVVRLMHALQEANVPVAVAHDGKRLQPVFCLMHRSMATPLHAFLASNHRKIDRFFEQVGFVSVDFSDQPDAFLNINTEEERAALEHVLAEKSATQSEVDPNDTTLVSGVPVLGFAAYSGSGKTTLLKSVIPGLRRHGLKIAVIKHAHHAFDLDVPGKDSHTLRSAGANQVIISSRQRRAWIIEHDDEAEPTLQSLIDSLDGQPVDLIIVEGYKRAPIPKIEIHRPSLGNPLLAGTDRHVAAVATDGKLPENVSVKRLDLNDHQQIIDYIVNWTDTAR